MKANINQNDSELYEDNLFNRNGGSDILKRKTYAKHIAQLISKQKTNNSFAIAIKGTWGSGKSVFITQIETELLHVIKIKFNPWLSKNPTDVLGDFFKVLIERTKSFDIGLSRGIKKYYAELENLDEKFNKKILLSLGLFKTEQSSNTEVQRKIIIERLKKKNLKLVVFIDDLDRLNSEEILTILKLIRNSFNFPNTFFFIAFDESYVLNILPKDINPEKFLEKIFQLEIDLPSFPANLIQNPLLDLLSKGKAENQIQKIKKVISILENDGILTDAFKNIRDVIRFSNSFNHAFKKKENEVDIFDFFLLETLKHTSRTIYKDIRNSLTNTGIVNYIKIPEISKLKSDFIHIKEDNFPKGEYLAFRIAKLLFSSNKERDEAKGIRIPGNSLRYFSDDLFGDISFETFEAYKQKDFTVFKNLIDQHINNQELEWKILRVNAFTDTSSFFNINKGLLYISNLKTDRAYANTVYGNFKNNFPLLKANISGDMLFKDYVTNLLTSDFTPPIAESQVCESIAVSIIENLPNNFPGIELEFIQNILIKNLIKTANSISNHFDIIIFSIYSNLWASLKDKNSNFIREANAIIGDYAFNNQKSFFSIVNLIRPKLYGSITGSGYILDPMIKDYLGYEKFEELLFNQKSSYEIVVLQNFYKKFKSNNYQEIEYYPNRIEIISDIDVQFIGSPDHQSLSIGPAVTRSEKLNYSRTHEQLKHANWISHAKIISLKEAIEGGIYQFSIDFNLEGTTKEISSTIVYFLVDDYLMLKVNDHQFKHDYFNYHLADPHKIDITKFITPGANKLEFSVRNKSSNIQELNNNPNNNPYEFIFNIVIELK